MKPANLGKPVRIAISGTAFVFFWSGGALLSWVILPLERLRPASATERRRRSQRWLRWGFRVFHSYLRTMGLTNFDPDRAELELPEGPFVLIANHPTLIDVTAIISVVEDLTTVVKGDYWRSSVASMLEQCGHIHGGDDGAMAAGVVAVEALERLADGQPVLIFPEGTRSPENGIHPFQRGAFEIARRAGVPLVPLLITCDPPTLMKHQPWYEVPVRTFSLRVRPLDHPEAGKVQQGSSKDQAARWRERYQQALDSWLRKRRGSGMVRDEPDHRHY